MAPRNRPPINAAVGTGKYAVRNGEPVSWRQEPPSDEPVGGDPGELGVFPLDEANAELLDNVAPREWMNPRPAGDDLEEEMYYDLVAIGAGAGGLVSAKQSARRGAKSALIERHLAGGDCLNVGCVPSKGLIRCARNAAEIRRASEFGSVPLAGDGAATHSLDFARVMERMRRLRARIAPADALPTTAKVGAGCFFGSGTFTSPSTIRVDLHDGTRRNIRFGKAVVATGGSAAVPGIPGLREAPYHTNNSLFNMNALPRRLVVIGAGPIGLEMAQAFALFGAEVTCVLRSDKVLPKEDPDAARIVREALDRDGVRFVTGIAYEGVEVLENGRGWTAEAPCNDGDFPTLRVNVKDRESGAPRAIECEAILVATGRRPNVRGLGLEAAGVAYDERRGVQVDDLLRTTNANVFAVGDVCSAFQFTHVAGTHAQMVVENALMGGEKRASDMVVPWCTFTEPEVAHVGAYERDLAERGVEVDTYTAGLEHNDRAILEGATEGFVRVHCRRGTEEILGATIVAPAAGEMISELTVAMQFKVPLGAAGLGSVIHSYPTMADGVGGCAFQCKAKSWARVRPDPATTAIEVIPGAAPALPARGARGARAITVDTINGMVLGAAAMAVLAFLLMAR